MADKQEDDVTTTTPPNVPGDGKQLQGVPVFTQAQVDAIVGERLRRDREKYSDYDELKKLSDDLKTALDDSKATLEQKEQAIADFQDAQAQWEVERAARDLRDSMMGAMREAGFTHPEQDYALLDFAQATEAPDKVGDQVAALAEARPDLVGGTPRPPATGATQPIMGRQPAPGEETYEQKLQRMGFAPGGAGFFAGGQLITPPDMEG